MSQVTISVTGREAIFLRHAATIVVGAWADAREEHGLLCGPNPEAPALTALGKLDAVCGEFAEASD